MTATRPSATASPASPQVTSLPGSGLQGEVVSASDVAGQADTVAADQLVLVIAEERVPALLGVEPSSPKLRFLHLTLPEPDPGIVTTHSDAQGRWQVGLEAGGYVICLADRADGEGDFPAAVRGCGRTTVSPNTWRQVHISSGFGEILVTDK